MHAKYVSRLVWKVFSLLLVSALLVAAMPVDDTPPPAAPRPVNFEQTEGSFPKYMTDGNGIVYFSADDGSGGRQALWRSDGTEEGTFKLADVFQPGEYSSWDEIISLINVNGVIYFAVSPTGFPSYPNDQLWKSDGTVEGTVLVKEIQSFSGGSPAGDTLIFIVGDGPNRGLWKSDGTSEGTTLLKAFTSGMGGMISANSLVFFTVQENGLSELWRSDGTQAGTFMLSSGDPNYLPFTYLTDVQGTLFFQGESGLSKSDGTLEGTVLVAPGLRIQDPLAVGNELFFFAKCGLWKSDGTQAGTVLVKELCGPYDQLPWISSEASGGNMFFIYGGLWRSDGTPEGTLKIKDFERYPSPYPVHRITAVNDSIFFPAGGDGLGYELWKSDGTQEGTVLVKDIRPGSEASEPGWTVNSGGTLFFAANDGNHLPELWKSDGTLDGTQMVKDINATQNHVVRGVHASGENLFIFLGTQLGEERGTL